jgi:tetratricopeptide (TPR) repeat protein
VSTLFFLSAPTVRSSVRTSRVTAHEARERVSLPARALWPHRGGPSPTGSLWRVVGAPPVWAGTGTSSSAGCCCGQALLCLVPSCLHAHADTTDVEQAETYYHQALALANELGMRPLQAHGHHGLGTLYARIGQQEQARTALATAIKFYRAMGMTFWLPRAEAMLMQIGGAEEPEGGMP